MSENEVAVDDAGLAIGRKTVNATVAGGWQDRTTDRDTVPSSWDEARLANIAAKMRQSSLHETLSDRVIGRARAAARGSQFIDYGFGVLYTLLTVRGALALIAASSTNGFVRLITEVTDPFYAPFRGIVPSPSVDGGNTLVVPLLIAIAIYALLHVGIRGLLRVFGTRKTR